MEQAVAGRVADQTKTFCPMGKEYPMSGKFSDAAAQARLDAEFASFADKLLVGLSAMDKAYILSISKAVTTQVQEEVCTIMQSSALLRLVGGPPVFVMCPMKASSLVLAIAGKSAEMSDRTHTCAPDELKEAVENLERHAPKEGRADTDEEARRRYEALNSLDEAIVRLQKRRAEVARGE